LTSEGHVFTCEVEWEEGKRASVKFGGKAALKFSYPPMFGGLEGFLYPEELFVASVNACTLTTLLYFAERLGLKLKGYRCQAEGVVEKNPEGHFTFKRLILKPTIEVAEGEESKANQTLEYVKKFCIVSRTVEGCVPIELKPEVRVKS